MRNKVFITMVALMAIYIGTWSVIYKVENPSGVKFESGSQKSVIVDGIKMHECHVSGPIWRDMFQDGVNHRIVSRMNGVLDAAFYPLNQLWIKITQKTTIHRSRYPDYLFNSPNKSLKGSGQ